jgi:ABC-type Zn uptake system ZnuABC Zn-binding protein ZnuA
MKPIRRLTFLTFLLFLFLSRQNPIFAWEKTRIVTTTSVLASITREITGPGTEIHYVASPNRNVHFIAPTPKDVLRVKKADLFIHTGLDLELWRDPLLAAAGNPAFLGGGQASIDASKNIPLLEIPTSFSKTEGDIHIFGNPHYWLDPENAKIMATNIAEGLARNFPEKADEFKRNAGVFNRKVDEKMRDWTGRMAPFKGSPVVTYHRSWSYLAHRFGLVVVGELEPKPGIPPTAKHIAELLKTMKEKKVKAVVTESFNEGRTPKKIAGETGARVLTLAQSVGEAKEIPDYLSMMEHNVRLLEEALGQPKGGTK